MTASSVDVGSPVRLRPASAADQPDVTPALEELYRGFEQELLVPLWTEIGDLMPAHPRSAAAPHLWGHPGLRPVAVAAPGPGSPLLAYRWEHTDRALADQLALEAEGFGGTVEPGHAAVRFTSPATGADVLPTIRAEMHRIVRGAQTTPVRETGSSVWQVFDGSGTVTVGEGTWPVTRGDLFVVPSWQPFSARSEVGPGDSDSGALDLFRFSDSPVFEALKLNRAQVEGSAAQ
jgi:gentisate 1,2-dioxygenase